MVRPYPRLKQSRAYDDKGRLASISHRNSVDAVLAEYDFTRDLDDQILAIAHHNRTIVLISTRPANY